MTDTAVEKKAKKLYRVEFSDQTVAHIGAASLTSVGNQTDKHFGDKEISTIEVSGVQLDSGVYQKNN